MFQQQPPLEDWTSRVHSVVRAREIRQHSQELRLLAQQQCREISQLIEEWKQVEGLFRNTLEQFRKNSSTS